MHNPRINGLIRACWSAPVIRNVDGNGDGVSVPSSRMSSGVDRWMDPVNIRRGDIFPNKTILTVQFFIKVYIRVSSHTRERKRNARETCVCVYAI